jgi:hypothetical protein
LVCFVADNSAPWRCGAGDANGYLFILVAVVNPRSSNVILSRTVSSISFSRNAAPYCFKAKADGTHSLRRTKAILIHQRTGSLRAVQLLSSPDREDRPIRIEVDDALAIAEQVEVWSTRAEQTHSAHLLGAVHKSGF